MPTDEEYDRFRRAVIKKLKFLEGQIDSAFEAINGNEDTMIANTDEALDKANRALRAVRRLKKDFDEHDHEENE